MSESANVHSIEAIAQFKASSIRFREDASSALAAMVQELQRVVEWFEQDRPRYWDNQVRKCYDRVAETRTALETCRMKKVAGRTPACIDEKVAFKKAKQQLEYSEAKLRLIRRWSDRVRREIGEFRGRMGNLQHILDGDMPRMIGLLDQTVTILDQYAAISSGDPSDGTKAISETEES